MALAETAQIIVDLRLQDGLSGGLAAAKGELASLETRTTSVTTRLGGLGSASEIAATAAAGLAAAASEAAAAEVTAATGAGKAAGAFAAQGVAATTAATSTDALAAATLAAAAAGGSTTTAAAAAAAALATEGATATEAAAGLAAEGAAAEAAATETAGLGAAAAAAAAELAAGATSATTAATATTAYAAAAGTAAAEVAAEGAAAAVAAAEISGFGASAGAAAAEVAAEGATAATAAVETAGLGAAAATAAVQAELLAAAELQVAEYTAAFGTAAGAAEVKVLSLGAAGASVSNHLGLLTGGLATARTELAATEARMGQVAITASRAGTSLGGLGSSLGAIAKIGAGAFIAFQAVDAVATFFKTGIEGAREEEAGIARLTAALKANVPAWDENEAAIEKVVSSRTALAFSDDELRASLGSLVVATKDINKAFDIQAIAVDLARFRNVSLADATDELVKVQAGSFRSLRSLGIETQNVTSSTQALKLVRDAVAGQSDKFLATDAGKAEALRVATDELSESFGRLVTGPLTDVEVALTNVFNILSGVAEAQVGTSFEQFSEQFRTFSTDATVEQIENVRAAQHKLYDDLANTDIAFAFNFEGARDKFKAFLAQIDAETFRAQHLFAEGMADVDQQSTGAGDAVVAAGGAIDAVTKAAGEAGVTTKTLAEAIQKLRDQAQGRELSDLAKDLYDAENGTSDLTRAVDALRASASTKEINALAQSIYDAEVAEKNLATQTAENIRVAHGYVSAVDDLTDALDGLPDQKTVKVDVPVSRDELASLKDELDGLPSQKTINIDVVINQRDLRGLQDDNTAFDDRGAGRGAVTRVAPPNVFDDSAADAALSATNAQTEAQRRVSASYDDTRTAADHLFDVLHDRHEKAIQDALKLAQTQHDSAIQRIDDALKAQEAVNAKPANEAEAALRDRQDAEQRRNLVESLQSAQGAIQANRDPQQAAQLAVQLRNATEALTNFDAQATIDRLHAVGAARDNEAEAAAKVARDKVDADLEAAKLKAAASEKFTTAADKKQKDDFDRALASLREKDKDDPAKFLQDSKALQARFGIFTDDRGFRHIGDIVAASIKGVKVEPHVSVNLHPSFVLKLGAVELKGIASAIAANAQPAGTPPLRHGTPGR